jgi:hypothetical protein
MFGLVVISNVCNRRAAALFFVFAPVLQYACLLGAGS